MITGNVDLFEHWHCNHGDYKNDKRISSAPTCQTREVRQRECLYCGSVEQYNGNMGNHLFEARCGKTHTLGSSSYAMNHSSMNGDPYTKTTKAECNICVYCYEGWDGKTRADGSEYAGWTTRNGERVSIGMYCRYHIFTYSEGSDDSYSSRPNRHLH